MGKSGGSGYDAAYNQGMLALAEGADERTQELFENYINGPGLDLENAQAQAGLNILPQQETVAGLQLDNEAAKLGYQGGLLGDYYSALGKNNPELSASMAATDTASAFTAVKQANDMTAKKRGLYRPTTSGLGYEEAKAIGSATYTARENAKSKNLEELTAGLSL